MILLDGKKLAEEIYGELKIKVDGLKERNIRPRLVIILVGDDPASLSYIGSKERAAVKTGIEFELLKYSPEEVSTEMLIAKITELNANKSVNGILVQLPLPGHVYAPDVMKTINPYKDVDGFTAYNLGKTLIAKDFEELAPCTPLGVIRLLEKYKIDVTGKEAVVVGASNIAGKPMLMMLLNRRATVTICHSKTENLAEHTRRADILVVSVGKINLITADMVKEGAVVVDVGINRTAEGKLTGDVDFENVSKKASYITPVPGGVGLMTVACLMENVYKATMKQISKGML